MTDDDQQSLFGELPALTPPSRIQQRLIRSAVEIEADDPDAILFQHTVFCQTGLPYRNPGPRCGIWERTQGRAANSSRSRPGDDLSSGRMAFVDVGLPFGPKPRLILAYLNAEALRTGSPEIEVEDSLTAFVCRIGLMPDGRKHAHHQGPAMPASPPQKLGSPWPTARTQARQVQCPHRQRLRPLVPEGRPTARSVAFHGAPFPRLLREPATPRRALGRAGGCRAVAQRHGARHLRWLAQRLHRVNPASPPSSRGRRSGINSAGTTAGCTKFRRGLPPDPRHGAEPVPGRTP